MAKIDAMVESGVSNRVGWTEASDAKDPSEATPQDKSLIILLCLIFIRSL